MYPSTMVLYLSMISLYLGYLTHHETPTIIYHGWLNTQFQTNINQPIIVIYQLHARSYIYIYTHDKTNVGYELMSL
jgi:hypothetical protein